MLNNLILLTFLPLILGFITLFLPQRSLRKNFACLAFSVGLIASICSFVSRPAPLELFTLVDFTLVLDYHIIAAFIMIFLNLFGLLVALYSGGYGVDKKSFYTYLLLLIGFANLTVMAGDFLTFAFGWGSMLVLLYAFLLPGSEATARKAVSVVGTADFMLILGISLYALISPHNTLIPSGGEGIVMDTSISLAAFILLFGGAIGKAGAWPFHPWIPDASTTASMPVMAILPASLDKLLGIYLLARVCTDLFVLNGTAMGIMLLVGGFTVLFAVMMALVQKDARRLLSYHAVSQVGYMVIGFGTGVPIGFAAGLFHMLNHAIYKAGLFLSAGAAGKEKGTFEIANLGGLAKYMPVTFFCALIFSLAISGVPPLNGFVSKWMVYQGTIAGLMGAGGVLRVIFILALLAAMFGSALTLASFVKFIHSVFLGQESHEDKSHPREAVKSMRYPMMVLAALCILLGAAPHLFLHTAVAPWMPEGTEMIGEWQALPAFILLAIGLLIGAGIVFGWLAKGKVRSSEAYFGGQEPADDLNYPATEFYKPVQEMAPLAAFYHIMNWKIMDIYCVLTSGFKIFGFILYYLVDRVINLLTVGVGMAVLGGSKVFRKAHTGNFDFYIVWCLLAMAILLFVIVR